MYGITVAFKDFKFNRGIMAANGSGWSISTFLTDKYFGSSSRTLVISLLVDLRLSRPIIMALFINGSAAGVIKGGADAVPPHFVSWVVVVALLNKLLSPSNGAIKSCQHLPRR